MYAPRSWSTLKLTIICRPQCHSSWDGRIKKIRRILNVMLQLKKPPSVFGSLVPDDEIVEAVSQGA
jgi:hypothetical protein